MERAGRLLIFGNGRRIGRGRRKLADPTCRRRGCGGRRMHGLRTANHTRQRLMWHGSGGGGRYPAEASTVAARTNLFFHAFGGLHRVRHERWRGIQRDRQEEDEHPAEYAHTGASYHGPEMSSAPATGLLPPVVDALKGPEGTAGRRAPQGRPRSARARPGLRLHWPGSGPAQRERPPGQGLVSGASNALAAGEAPSWVAAMLGHTSPEMLFCVYARFIPNRTRRDGSALLSRMTERANAETAEPASAAVLPKYSR